MPIPLSDIIKPPAISQLCQQGTITDIGGGLRSTQLDCEKNGPFIVLSVPALKASMENCTIKGMFPVLFSIDPAKKTIVIACANKEDKK